MSKATYKPGFLAQIFLYFGSFLIFTGFRSGSGVFMGVVYAIPFLVIGVWIASRDTRDAVVDANIRALWTLRNAVAAASRGESLPATLYLRPFELTGRLQLNNPRPAAFGTPESYVQPTVLDLETLLAEELASDHPLVALGLPGEHVGAGRIFASEDEWRAAVKDLTAAVSRIVVIPSANPGTRWELNMLREVGAFGKTVLLMPPKPDAGELDMQSYWEDTRAVLAEDGFGLPAYEEDGALLSLDPQGGVLRSQALHLWREGYLRKLVDAVSERPVVEAGNAGKATEAATPGETQREAPIGLPPSQTRLPTVPYFVIAGGFVVVSLLFKTCE